MTPPRPSSVPQRYLWVSVWILAGILHLTQAIWVNQGNGVPAGLGDGRFNQLVLEHGYQSWKGHYDWRSPGQFYPTTHTLGWSDTHLGTLPIYVGLRSLSVTPERSWQAWFVICSALNLSFGFLLLRRLGLTDTLAAPITFAAFAGLPAVWLAGTHPQLLPVFPGLWALLQLVKFSETRRLAYLGFFASGLAWQFATGPYLAFFTTLVACFGTSAFLALGRLEPTHPNSLEPNRWVPSALVALLGGTMGLVNLGIYLRTLNTGVERPMSEVTNLCPNWASWFSASPAHAIYPSAWPAHASVLSQPVLFAGFLPWLLAIIAVIVGIRFRAIPLARWAAVLGIVGIALVLFTVRWPSGFSVWLTLAERFEPLRAFRAIGRIVVYSHALMVGATGLLLAFWIRSTPSSRIPRQCSSLICGLLLVEGLASNQPFYLVQESVARRTAVVEAWQNNGDTDVLAFAPGFTNQNDTKIHLDAWAAALSRQRVTLNGYSGGAPSSHLGFIWSPTRANATDLIQRLELDQSEVSIVTNFDPEIAVTLGYEFFSQRELQPLEGFDLPTLAWSLFAPPERFAYPEAVFYQFTPNAEVSFQIPDQATRISFLTGGRAGSYSDGGDSDGYSLSWTVSNTSGDSIGAASEHINPRDIPSHRGFLPRLINLPAGKTRILTLSFGPGPSGLNNWDWPLLGQLRVE